MERPWRGAATATWRRGDGVARSARACSLPDKSLFIRRLVMPRMAGWIVSVAFPKSPWAFLGAW